MKLAELFSKISATIFVLFVLEMALGGAGDTLHVFGVNIRYFLFSSALAVFFLLKLTVAPVPKYTQNDVVCIFVFAVFALFWVAVVPLVRGQNIGYAVKDAAPLIGAAIMVSLFDKELLSPYWSVIRKLLYLLLILFAIVHVVIYILGLLNLDYGISASTLLRTIFEMADSDESKFVFIFPSDWGLRVYFGSSFFLLIGLYFSIFYDGQYSTKFKIGSTLLFLGGVLATGTRSLILASLVFLGVATLKKGVKYRIKSNIVFLFVLLALPIVIVMLLVPTINPDVAAAGSFSRGASDLIRPEQMQGLLKAFIDSPLLGKGFGSSVPPIRNIEVPYSYELSIMALYMKIGVLGIFVIVSGVTLFAYPLLAMSTKDRYRHALGIYGLYFSIVVGSFYNPYLFGFFGTFFIVFLCLELKFHSRMTCYD